ncbi:glycosyltransferase family 2 protein [Rothia nasimurium]|uniref:glycosyltransferase family 2 protein n=1 Tax=Rothia nasimurium TaxID=85336 RepID=UPI001F1B9FF5|nr:glycosyltransferase family A protein [Rothia nasimurium]
MTAPKVSIIVTVYNRVDFLRETISSALNQSCKPHEIIIVNDGSTDPNVLGTLEKFESDQCKVVSIDNRGPAGARNYGRTLATGDYLIFLDDDDVILESYISDNLSNILENNLDVSYSKASLLTPGGERTPWDLPPFDKRQIILDNCIYISAVMKSSCFDAVGGFDENFIEGHEDHDFWVRMASRGFKIGRVENLGFLYRQTGRGVNGKYAGSVDSMVNINTAISKNSPEIYIDNIDVLWREIIELRLAVRRYQRIYGKIDSARIRFGKLVRSIRQKVLN